MSIPRSQQSSGIRHDRRLCNVRQIFQQAFRLCCGTMGCMAGMSDAHILCHFPVCTQVSEPHPPEKQYWILPSRILKPTLLQSGMMLVQLAESFEFCGLLRIDVHTNSIDGWRRKVGHYRSKFDVYRCRVRMYERVCKRSLSAISKF
jgi:hypothetical protein